jgi:hypothetical protein
MAQHVSVPLDAQFRHDRCPLDQEKPGAESGAPRSETNTNGDLALALWCRRSSRNSRPVNG